MSFRSALPRLLLIAMLLLSSLGSAVAEMRMTVVDAWQRSAIAARATDAHAPCHEAAAMQAEAPSAPAPEEGGASDCCSVAGHCDGFCLQALPALPDAARWAHAPPSMQALDAHDQSTHPAPPLERPQRPPIA